MNAHYEAEYFNSLRSIYLREMNRNATRCLASKIGIASMTFILDFVIGYYLGSSILWLLWIPVTITGYMINKFISNKLEYKIDESELMYLYYDGIMRKNYSWYLKCFK